MTPVVGAYGARLPDEDTATPLTEILSAELLPSPPSTTEMTVARPVPRARHLAPADSPVGRAGRRPRAASAVEQLADECDIDLTMWPDSALHLLTAALLEIKHERIARWLALTPPMAGSGQGDGPSPA